VTILKQQRSIVYKHFFIAIQVWDIKFFQEKTILKRHNRAVLALHVTGDKLYSVGAGGLIVVSH
jgi:hypothetical protein